MKNQISPQLNMAATKGFQRDQIRKGESLRGKSRLIESKTKAADALRKRRPTDKNRYLEQIAARFSDHFAGTQMQLPSVCALSAKTCKPARLGTKCGDGAVHGGFSRVIA
jgi:hypothetical protein